MIGDSKYRGGKSLHALIDGGPYSGVVKVPVSFNDQLEGTKKGDEIKAWVKLVISRKPKETCCRSKRVGLITTVSSNHCYN